MPWVPMCGSDRKLEIGVRVVRREKPGFAFRESVCPNPTKAEIIR
jgi:hypothetical protein